MLHFVLAYNLALRHLVDLHRNISLDACKLCAGQPKFGASMQPV